MLKLMGIVMIIGACGTLGLSARQALRRRVTAADAMLLALHLIDSEIAARRTPMPELIETLAEQENSVIRVVFSDLSKRLQEQNGLSLGYQWRACLRDKREQIGLGAQECDILCEAAGWLGRYDAAEQRAGLRVIAQRLQAAREAAQSELQNKGNLYRTCGIALGILVVLVLL